MPHFFSLTYSEKKLLHIFLTEIWIHISFIKTDISGNKYNMRTCIKIPTNYKSSYSTLFSLKVVLYRYSHSSGSAATPQHPPPGSGLPPPGALAGSSGVRERHKVEEEGHWHEWVSAWVRMNEWVRDECAWGSEFTIASTGWDLNPASIVAICVKVRLNFYLYISTSFPSAIPAKMVDKERKKMCMLTCLT